MGYTIQFFKKQEKSTFKHRLVFDEDVQLPKFRPESSNKDEINDNMQEFQKYLVKQKTGILFFFDEYVDSTKWDEFSTNVKPLANVGYLFANVDYMGNTKIGPHTSKNIPKQNFLGLSNLSIQNLCDGFAYFFPELSDSEISYLKGFIFPFLRGRPLFLFLFFRSIRELRNNPEPTLNCFKELMDYSLDETSVQFKWRVAQAFNKLEAEEKKREYGNVLLNLVVDPASLNAEHISGNLVCFKTTVPDEVKTLQFLGLVAFKTLTELHYPEPFIVYCIKQNAFAGCGNFSIHTQKISHRLFKQC